MWVWLEGVVVRIRPLTKYTLTLSLSAKEISFISIFMLFLSSCVLLETQFMTGLWVTLLALFACDVMLDVLVLQGVLLPVCRRHARGALGLQVRTCIQVQISDSVVNSLGVSTVRI